MKYLTDGKRNYELIRNLLGVWYVRILGRPGHTKMIYKADQWRYKQIERKP